MKACGAALIVACLPCGMSAAANQAAHENGIGADPDGDGNPATNTKAMVRIGDAADEKLGAPYRVITFEPPPGRNGDLIGNHYAKEFGVRFGDRLKRQICEGQRYLQFDSLCTYLAPPSGSYAAVYRDEWKRPLEIRFDKPVCAAALAIYPTGGKEGEKFRITMQPWKDDKTKLAPAKVELTWTADTFRWRSMVSAFFVGADAARVDVSVRSLDNASDFMQFLIDDVAFVENGCDALLKELEQAVDEQGQASESEIAAE